MIELDPAQHERHPGLERVGVDAEADADQLTDAAPFAQPRGDPLEVGRVVTFSSRSSPATTSRGRPPLASTSDAQSEPSPRDRGPEHRCDERLRRLHRDELARARASRPRRPPSHALDRVGDRQRRAPRRPSPRRAPRAGAGRSSGGSTGRAASWTRITAASSGTSATPRRTDSVRVSPPGHARRDLRGAELLGQQDRRLLPLRRRDEHDRRRPTRTRRAAAAAPRAAAARRAGRTPSAGRRRAAPLALRRRERPRRIIVPQRVLTQPVRGCGSRLLAPAAAASSRPAATAAARLRGDRSLACGASASRPSVRVSSSHASASSSDIFFAYISSDARIFFALTYICFSPVERPFSPSRSARFRTTSASS